MLEGLISKSVSSPLRGHLSNAATYMLHLGLTAERLDAIIEVSHNTWMLYAYDAFLRHCVEQRRGGRACRLHVIWLHDQARHVGQTRYTSQHTFPVVRLAVARTVV
jgi:hypothetical protein